jgi:hypothetical protein
MNTLKYNLLHKKNLKEINVNLQKAKKVILSIDSTKTEKKILNNNKIYTTINTNVNAKTIDSTLNSNMNIIENPENIIINSINSNTTKLNKKNVSKKLPIKSENKLKEKYLINTIDKNSNIHQINKTSVNLNSYLQNMFENNNLNNMNMSTKKQNTENNFNFHKLSNKITKKNLNRNLNLNIEINNKKNNLNNFIDKNDNLDIFEKMLKTEPNHHKLIKKTNKIEKKDINQGKLLDENRKQFIQVKLPIFNPSNKNKSNLIKKQKNENILTNNNNNNKNKIPKNLNRTSNSNFNSFIQNPFITNNPNNINKLFIHTNNGSFNQSEQNLSKKFNEKNNNNNLNSLNNNLNMAKKKPLVSIRNTVINFNMIDSGLILDSLKRKKKGNKLLNNNFASNNSVNKLTNNHLFGLCNKFNSNISLNNNSTNKKIFKYGDKLNNKFNSKKQMTNHDKSHIKFNSMRLDDYYGLNKRKNMKNINTNKIDNLRINDTNKILSMDMNHFNTINN